VVFLTVVGGARAMLGPAPLDGHSLDGYSLEHDGTYIGGDQKD
jgi:hypothetical protein